MDEDSCGAPLSLRFFDTAGLNGGRVAFISAGCSYRPNLLRALHDWNGEGCSPRVRKFRQANRTRGSRVRNLPRHWLQILNQTL